MSLYNNEKEWFFSKEGCEEFAKLKTLAERIAFIYSYLKSNTNNIFRSRSVRLHESVLEVVNANWPKVEEDNLLLKTALLLADEVYASSMPYAKYPDIIDKKKNPIVAYLENVTAIYEKEAYYLVLLSIIHGYADPFDSNAWIYKDEIFSSNSRPYIKLLQDSGVEFKGILMDNPAAYEIEDAKKKIQMEIIWLFSTPCVDDRKN